MKITWLGQGGFLFEQDGKRLVVDPYLSDALAAIQGLPRLVPPPIAIDALAPTAVFITHDHLDHFDPETMSPLVKRWPNCVVAGPQSVVTHARKLGVRTDRLALAAIGTPLLLPGFAVTPTPAKHSDPAAVGMLIDSGDRLIYLSGDTLYTPELSGHIGVLARRPLDAAMLCINGRLGNMNLQEAAELAAAIKPKVAVPMHYGLFAANTADPLEFVAACRARKQNTLVLEIGIPTTL